MLGVNAVAADSDEEARFLATSGRQSFASLRRGMPRALPPPNREFERDVVPFGAIPLTEIQSVSLVGIASHRARGAGSVCRPDAAGRGDRASRTSTITARG